MAEARGFGDLWVSGKVMIHGAKAYLSGWAHLPSRGDELVTKGFDQVSGVLFHRIRKLDGEQGSV
jgi:hypothetical protein